MHLMRGISDTNTRKSKVKMTKAKTAKWKDDWKLDCKWRKQENMAKLTFEEYCDNRTGTVKYPEPKFKTLQPKPARGSFDEHRAKYPSMPMSVGDTPRKEPMKYDGERQLLGIATMHKSNMVPVFSVEEATDISRMRRG